MQLCYETCLRGSYFLEFLCKELNSVNLVSLWFMTCTDINFFSMCCVADTLVLGMYRNSRMLRVTVLATTGR